MDRLVSFHWNTAKLTLSAGARTAVSTETGTRPPRWSRDPRVVVFQAAARGKKKNTPWRYEAHPTVEYAGGFRVNTYDLLPGFYKSYRYAEELKKSRTTYI